MKSSAGKSCEAFFNKGFFAINETGNFSAILFRAVRNACNIALVILAKICGVSTWDRASFTHPGNRHRSVEAAGECNSNSLTDWE
jgi:hypothetical protein